MRKYKNKDSSFYESLSDISMATLGIFIIFFVINLIFLKSDVILLAARNTSLSSEITSTEKELLDLKKQEKQLILDYKTQIDNQVVKINKKIDSMNVITSLNEVAIEEIQEKIKEEMNVDEVISIEEVRKILRKVKLQRKEAENELNDVKMKTNNVRQEFNEYVEVENSYPYLLIDIKDNDIYINDVWFHKTTFRHVLQNINAGSGFTFRMVNGKYDYDKKKFKRKKAPDWLNDMLVSEGWFPIIDVDI